MDAESSLQMGWRPKRLTKYREVMRQGGRRQLDEAPRLITGSAACESLTDCRQIRYRQAEDPCKQART